MQNSWFIIATLILLPVYVILLSMCAYIGKVWAIRILFKEEWKKVG